MHLKVQSMDLLTIYVEKGPLKMTHFHSSIELIMVLDGKLTVNIEGEKYHLGKEDVILINSNLHHGCESDSEICFLRLSLSYSELCRLLSHSKIEFKCNSVLEKGEKYEELKIILRKLLNIYYQKSETKVLQFYNLSYQFVQLLTDKFMAYLGNDDNDNLDSEEVRITEIINYIGDQYRNDISLQDLADQLHLSISYLSRYIKEALGCNFLQYLNQVRMEHAIEELLFTDAPVTRVAYDNGFANVAAFNKRFKELYDETPSAYRRKKQKEDEFKEGQEAINRMMDKVEEYLNEHPDEELREKDSHFVPIKVNVAENKIYEKNWNQVINIGAASDLLLSSVQEHILILKKELGFKYIRFWNIFGADMHVTEKNKDGFNLSNVYRILDFLTQNGLKPYIELGFKPRQIVKNVQDSEVDEEAEVVVNEVEDLQELMEFFMKNIVHRYTEEEVNTWYFENWGDKRLLGSESNLSYFKVFMTVYEVVKKYAPDAKVGGAGISINDNQCRRLEKMLTRWKEEAIKPDFLSVYLYPYMRSGKGINKHIQQSVETEFLVSQLKIARECIDRMGFSPIELHVTEWNITLSNRNFINDSCFKAGYLAKSMMAMNELADKVVYFLGTDLFSEFYDTNTVLYGGAGLLSQDGIFKPSFYAFRYMNRLGNKLIYSDEHCIITADDKKGYRIICFNMGKLNYRYFMNKEDKIEGDKLETYFDEEDAFNLHILLEGVDDGNYKIKARRLNTQFGSALDEWKRIDMDESLDKFDIRYLKQICVPRHVHQNTSTNSHILNLKVPLDVQEMQYIQVEYMGESKK
jgi:beta-xylosidase/AraC-like DNA-binding protein